ncbi:hypothetical protein SAMN02745157_4087 [Kaistia soli DSM 19436]|uniref:Uncharacterized protein n=1 Tax=Kaistia soli DSM 19436 TaxID=1122133 RepID=A0A1M5J392_9HYPH|nr:hypothetical protein [Kaistia soli]SHG35034.1 hypothetical protein SAMN02745157_4087 [Kaistia soli DSM 19436]
MIAVGILCVFAVLACHWLGIYLIRRMFETTLALLGARRALGSEIAFALAIFGLVILNFTNVLICTLLVMAGGSGIAFEHAFHFAIANFTTVGLAAPVSGSVAAVAGPLIAMCGIVSFGWSTSFLVSCSRAIRVPVEAMTAGGTTTKVGSSPTQPWRGEVD